MLSFAQAARNKRDFSGGIRLDEDCKFQQMLHKLSRLEDVCENVLETQTIEKLRLTTNVATR